MEISPEKRETLEFWGQDELWCKILAVNKRLQNVKNYKYLGCEISSENEKDIKWQSATFAEGNFNNLKTNLF